MGFRRLKAKLKMTQWTIEVDGLARYSDVFYTAAYKIVCVTGPLSKMMRKKSKILCGFFRCWNDVIRSVVSSVQ